MRFALAILLVSLSVASTTNILDLIYRDVAKQSPAPESKDKSAENEDKTCNCIGHNCICCVDFNVTYIDLGGPGCVKMQYLSQMDGLMVNVSYGESLLHSEQIKGPNPKPTCMALLASFAEVCATFTSLNTYNDGLKGCLQLEPMLLGDIQTQFNIGCFIMGPEGMRVDESVTEATTQSAEDTNQRNNTESINTADILAAVNESAYQGLAFFQNLFSPSSKNATNSPNLAA